MADEQSKPTRLVLIEREDMAYKLWLDGRSYREIAKAMQREREEGRLEGLPPKYGYGHVYRDVNACIKRLTKAFANETEERRHKMRDRLERLFAHAWNRATGAPKFGQPTVDEENRVAWSGEARSALDQLAKLDGMYAPAKHALTTPDGERPYDPAVMVDPAAIGMRAANLLAAIVARAGGQPDATEASLAVAPEQSAMEGSGA